jgi:hypothetical protein
MIERLDLPGQAPDGIDRVLHDYFRAEMPDPWPRLVLPRPNPVVRRSRNWFRFALAASVSLALLGYWAVAGQFPGDSPVNQLIPMPGSIGKNLDRPGHKGVQYPAPQQQLSPVEHIRMPSGSDAQMFNEDLPNGQAIIIIVGPSGAKGPR